MRPFRFIAFLLAVNPFALARWAHTPTLVDRVQYSVVGESHTSQVYDSVRHRARAAAVVDALRGLGAMVQFLEKLGRLRNLCGEPMTEIEKIEPGTLLGRYECLHPIGKGGMGAVWAARVVGDDSEKIVAVKTVLPQHADNPDYVDMLLDEGRILSGIRHPNVASLLDMGNQDGAFYLAFEWVEGEQLSKLRGELKKKQLTMPVGLALRVVADVCGGLHSAHEVCDAEGRSQRIVHRDVSPQNIMVSCSGDVKLIDFGIAKALDRIADETVAGMVKGKVLYMSPEQVTGGSLDRRVDVWAAGAVLYHLVSGRTPFGTNQPLRLMDCLATRSEPDPLPADLHPAVSRTILGALRPVREERYPTAADFQRDLEQAIAQAVGSVTREDLAAFVREHAGRFIEERRAAIAGARAALQAKSPGKPPAIVIPAPSESAPNVPAPRAPRASDPKVPAPRAPRASDPKVPALRIPAPNEGVPKVPAPRAPRASDPRVPALRIPAPKASPLSVSHGPVSAPAASAPHAAPSPPQDTRVSEPELEPVDFPLVDAQADEFDMPSLEEPMFAAPSPEVPPVPSPEVPAVPSPEVPAVPSPQVPDVPSPEVPAVPSPQVPDVPSPEVPDVPSPQVPDVPSPEVPDVPSPEVPDVPSPEVPDVPSPEVPDVPSPEVRAQPSDGAPKRNPSLVMAGVVTAGVIAMFLGLVAVMRTGTPEAARATATTSEQLPEPTLPAPVADPSGHVPETADAETPEAGPEAAPEAGPEASPVSTASGTAPKIKPLKPLPLKPPPPKDPSFDPSGI
jgi:serine/threonine-protein kinase